VDYFRPNLPRFPPAPLPVGGAGAVGVVGEVSALGSAGVVLASLALPFPFALLQAGGAAGGEPFAGPEVLFAGPGSDSALFLPEVSGEVVAAAALEEATVGPDEFVPPPPPPTGGPLATGPHRLAAPAGLRSLFS